MSRVFRARLLFEGWLLLPVVAVGQSEDVLFQKMPVVEAAALHAQSVADAPASATVITAEEIRKYGLRTLGEALSLVRGMYLTGDRNYGYLGVRGVAVPGDYTTRILVMVNGHYMTDRVYSSNGYFGEDFGLDMDLVHRIEVIRGPSSALYGSNGVLATINIVTKSPVDVERARVTVEAGSYGAVKAQAAAGVELGRGANLLVSGSGFRSTGPELRMPEFATAANPEGLAQKIDGERGYHQFANLIWRNWSFLMMVNSREKQIPVGWTGFLYGDRGSRSWDERNFAEAVYLHEDRGGGELQVRMSYDWYRYRGTYRNGMEDGRVQDNRDEAKAGWATARVTYHRSGTRAGEVTVGGEVVRDVFNRQRNFDVMPVRQEYLTVGSPDTTGGLFVQDEFSISKRWKANAGLRLDSSRHFGQTLSPKLALLFEPEAGVKAKFLYGRSFRNPNGYEAFYTDELSILPNPELRREHVDTLEVVLERRVRPRIETSYSAYYYRLEDLIQLSWLNETFTRFENAGRLEAAGVEAEMRAKLPRGVQAQVSFAFQNNREFPLRVRLANSPLGIAQFHLDFPIGRRWTLATAGHAMSARNTLQGGQVDPVFRWDWTLSSEKLSEHVEVQAGVRNLLGMRYRDPVALSSLEDSMEQNGRTAFVRVTFRWDR